MNLRQLFATLAVSAVATVFAFNAKAADWQVQGEFGWFGVGTAHQISDGHLYWVGEFSGTFFNDKGEGSLLHRAGVKCPSWFDIFLNDNKADAGGYCVMSDPDGDQAYARWRSGPGGTPAGGPGTFEWLGGTGKYAGITGTNTYHGHVQVSWPDGNTTGYATWNR